MSESTSVTLFYTNEGRHPRFTVNKTLDKAKTSPTTIIGPKKLKRK